MAVKTEFEDLQSAIYYDEVSVGFGRTMHLAVHLAQVEENCTGSGCREGGALADQAPQILGARQRVPSPSA